ncbi:MAG: type II toxin-antitoxin system VapC family toxin [Bryobacteraceae bacterium]|jgi:predicted nucleic acid-binding protein
MITAIDTNVLLDVLIPSAVFCDRSMDAIQDSAAAGSLVICDLVYAELCVHFRHQRECDDFLAAGGIRVESLTRAAHFRASRVWRDYRRQGGSRARILADFLVGAHAELQASRLLSRDRGFYGKLFPSLNLVDPGGHRA